MWTSRQLARATFICLILTIVNFEHVNARSWEEIFYVGSEPDDANYEYGSIRSVIEKASFEVKTSPNDTTIEYITFIGDGSSKVKIAYLARWDVPEASAKMKFRRDYFVSVAGGGTNNDFITWRIKVLPNPTNEPIRLESQLITYNDS